ncbi:hypothetical protein BGW80DRAFT_1544685 [Lactifluus volemus]|nr:hypothetical protein BGW80DRAFT_1544685 [Lactifluus volemus]
MHAYKDLLLLPFNSLIKSRLMPPSRPSSIDMDDIGSMQPSRPLVFQPLLDSSLKEYERRTREDFDIHRNRPTHEVTRYIFMETLVELFSTLSLVTRQYEQGLLKAIGKKLLGRNDTEVEVPLRKVERLSQDVDWGPLGRPLRASTAVFGTGGDQMRRDLQSWLCPSDPWKNHNIACGAHHCRTATWFIRGDTFSEWKSSGSLLWICGEPGAGKTTLCSTIVDAIDDMRKSGSASMAFFYCDFRDDQREDPRGLLSSILFQLCGQSNSNSEILFKFYSKHRDGLQGPSAAALTQ